MKFTFPESVQRNATSDEKCQKALGILIDIAKVSSYEQPESFLSFVFDEGHQKQIQEIVDLKTKKGIPKVVFVVGIGGANLASKAVYDAHTYMQSIVPHERNMVFLDTTDTDAMKAVEMHSNSFTSSSDFVIVIVTKSGSTIETLANSEFLVAHLEQKFPDVLDRIVVITAQDSLIHTEAKQKGITTVLLPKVLSDRFSVFSPTTLVPLALFGFPINTYLDSARIAVEKFSGSQKDSLFDSVFFLSDSYQKGFHILDTWYFASRLETAGKWHRQLIAESLGKEKTGFTPVVSMGTVDLHSSLQLDLAGPKERVTEFVIQEEVSREIQNAETINFLDNEITQKGVQEIKQTILNSVMHSYRDAKLPYYTITLPVDHMEAIAHYFVYSMIQTYILGELFGVNVFDQPAVESYKTEARETLS